MPRQDSNLLRSITAALWILASIIMPVADQHRHGGATPADRQLTKGTFTVSSSERNVARPQ